MFGEKFWTIMTWIGTIVIMIVFSGMLLMMMEDLSEHQREIIEVIEINVLDVEIDKDFVLIESDNGFHEIELGNNSPTLSLIKNETYRFNIGHYGLMSYELVEE